MNNNVCGMMNRMTFYIILKNFMYKLFLYIFYIIINQTKHYL